MKMADHPLDDPPFFARSMPELGKGVAILSHFLYTNWVIRKAAGG